MIDVWHTQLRLVSKYFSDHQLRAIRQRGDYKGEVFAYVTPSVARRELVCPPSIIEWAKEKGYVVIHVQEPRD